MTIQITQQAIEQIDATLQARQDDRSVAGRTSYSIEMMRDANKAGKKAGEEFAEVMMAIVGESTVAECESELADLIFGVLIAARSRNKPVELANVLHLLINRNLATT